MIPAKNIIPILMLILSLNYSHGMETVTACPPHQPNKTIIIVTQDNIATEVHYEIAMLQPTLKLVLQKYPNTKMLAVNLSLYDLMAIIKELAPTAVFNILAAD